MSQDRATSFLPQPDYGPSQSPPPMSPSDINEDASSMLDLADENLIITPITTGLVAAEDNKHTESSVITLPGLETNMKSWSLAQLRAELAKVVIHRQSVSSHEKGVLEIRRLALIERVNTAERAEQRKRDAARRVVIGVDVHAPPPDPVEKPWQKRPLRRNSRRSGPKDRPEKGKKINEDEESNSEQELHSKRWKGKRKRELEEQAEEQAEGTGYLIGNTKAINGVDAQSRKKQKLSTAP